MSHRATNWAIMQRGLKPVAKLLLWQLADRHNGDTGRCDPSISRLADDCEVSAATVCRHLAELEQKGLIRRVRRVNERTRGQTNTSYQLGMDLDLLRKSGEHQLNGQEVFNVPWKQTDAGISA